DPRRHRLVHGDVREALADLRETFDLAVVDPPTFSTSKRMEGTFDVQRDHPALLAAVPPLIAPRGAIWFSTHNPPVDFAPPARLAPTWRITDETAATLPPDFRDRRVHQAYRIEVASRD